LHFKVLGLLFYAKKPRLVVYTRKTKRQKLRWLIIQQKIFWVTHYSAESILLSCNCCHSIWV